MSQASDLSPARRWALVGERLQAEQRAATDETKLAQVASLMESVDDFDWREKLSADDDRVRDLWRRLRAAWGSGQVSSSP